VPTERATHEKEGHGQWVGARGKSRAGVLCLARGGRMSVFFRRTACFRPIPHPVLTIAVISDTHDHLPESVLRTISAADEIWHLGDVCRPDVLDPLLLTGKPLVVVRGNCDYTWEWPATRRLERGGRVFFLEHVPPRRPPTGVDFVLHGHTHVPRDEVVLGVRFLNPGCISRPNRGAPASHAWLRVGSKGAVEWEIVPVV
jgi:uncharacterized protein